MTVSPSNVYCRICGAPGAACGDSHQTLPLLTSAAFFKRGPDMNEQQSQQEQGKSEQQSQRQQERQQQRQSDRTERGEQRKTDWQEQQEQPKELQEYHYYVGHMEVTAMMTPEMAEQLDAKPIDEELDEPTGGKESNNEANRMSTRSREADDAGVTSKDDPDGKTATGKSREARNKRAGGS